MNREYFLAQALGEKKVFSIPAKVLLGRAGGTPYDVQTNLHHTMIVGSGFTSAKILAPENGWEMLECEIIIIPKVIHRKNKEPEFGHLRADQAMTAHCWNADRWREHETFNKKGVKDE